MQIQLNGETQTVADGATIEQLLASLGLSDRRVAVELNREIVPRASFAATTVRAGDVVEVVQFVGGG